MRAVLVLGLIAAACSNDAGDEVTLCYFESGRPCPADTVCLGPKGDECNYYTCQPDGSIVGTALGCLEGDTEPQPTGAPFNCDPATITREPGEGGFTPPQGGCFLGALRVIDPSRPVFPFGACVPVEQCLPIACDPRFDGDGCPSGLGCDADSRTCGPDRGR